MVKDVQYLVTHSLRCKATDRFYDHSGDRTALILMQEKDSQVLKAMLLFKKKKERERERKKKFLGWVGSKPGLNMLNCILPPLWDGNARIPHVLSLYQVVSQGGFSHAFPYSLAL